jgi:hypothetical protein
VVPELDEGPRQKTTFQQLNIQQLNNKHHGITICRSVENQDG